MGREVRKVPKDWEHPKGDNGAYEPLDDGYKERRDDWVEGFADWYGGGEKKFKEDGAPYEYWEYHGDPPHKDGYIPDWTDEEKTHYQMYESVSEGTPISPVMESPEVLAQWLVDNEADAFAGSKASYEGWLSVARGGYAPSCVAYNNKMLNGVEASRIFSSKEKDDE